MSVDGDVSSHKLLTSQSEFFASTPVKSPWMPKLFESIKYSSAPQMEFFSLSCHVVTVSVL